MPPVAELVAQARAAGVTISRGDDGHLRMRGPRRAAEIAQALRDREDEVLAFLPAHRCLCGTTTGVRLYISGYRCPEHTPAALAGRPEPDAPLKPVKPERTRSPQPAAVPSWPAGETGPCARCRSLCHRYGDHGNPLCGDCRKTTNAAA